MLSRESAATAMTSPRYPSGGPQIRRSSCRVHSAAVAVTADGRYRVGFGPAGRRKVGERLRLSAEYSVIENTRWRGIVRLTR